MQFNLLPEAEIVGQHLSQDEFFDWMFSHPSGWEGLVAIDTETTGIDSIRDMPVFGSASDGKRRFLFDVQTMLDSRWDDLFLDDSREWAFANAKFDMHMLYNVGMHEIRGVVHDVIVMCALLDENRKEKNALNLKSQSLDYLGIPMTPFKEFFGINAKEEETGKKLLSCPIDKVAAYATLDAYATHALAYQHRPNLEEYSIKSIVGYKNLWDYYIDLEVPITKALWRMERRGFCLDLDVLQSVEEPIVERRRDALEELIRLAKFPINPRSTAQISKVLFGDKKDGGLQLKPIKFSDKPPYKPSTDDYVLTHFAKKGVNFCKVLQKYRATDKLDSTYIKALNKKRVPRSGRVHCSFNQTGTVTGRFSCSKPNLQNIPSRDPLARRIRNAFVADSHCKLIVADYSQMEMCVMAHYSQDEYMLEAINSGLDLHAYTASRMLNFPYEHIIAAKILNDLDWDIRSSVEATASKLKIKHKDAQILVDEISPEYAGDLLISRSNAKAIGFGMIYGMGPGKLSDDLNISMKEAKDLIKAWFEAFPKVRVYMDDMKRAAEYREDHTVFTLFGRPRRLHSILSDNKGKAAKAGRDAINAPIQGSASCIVKLAMKLIDQDPVLGGDCLEGGSAGCGMLLQIHDELVLELDTTHKTEQEVQCIVDRMKKIMRECVELAVPLKTSGGIALSWGEAK